MSLIGLLVLACVPSEPAEDTGEAGDVFYPPEAAGPYDAGVTRIEVVDPRGKELTIEIWYPATVSETATPDAYEELPLALEAFRDVPPEAGRFPLVAFSHGYGGIRYQSAFLTEHLATHGFVVVAPDHNDNTLLDLDPDVTDRVVIERPDDVRYAVDAAVAFLGADAVDLAPGYAVVGHSFGAFTAMVVGGGLLNYEGVLTHCEESGYSSRGCRELDGFDRALLETSYGTVDERATVTVPMSPGLWYAFEPDGSGLAGVHAPLVLGGDRDQVLDYADEIRPSYESLGAPRRLATFLDGGHYAFSDICLIAAALFEDCAGPEAGWINIERAHLATRAVVTAHIEVELLGDARYRPWLTAAGLAAYPEVVWEAEE